jgi:hypothetical protein
VQEQIFSVGKSPEYLIAKFLAQIMYNVLIIMEILLINFGIYCPVLSGLLLENGINIAMIIITEMTAE